MAILVTGGAGYIGTHTCVALLSKGYELVVVDNFSNSKPESLKRVREITGKTFAFYEADLLDRSALDRIFTEHEIDAVIHFAGLKAVGESVEEPLNYYQNNVTGTLNLCQAMDDHGVYHIVFSSSATVYGLPKTVPIKEDAVLDTMNPYGRTKWMIEEILRDLHTAESQWSITLLRYFNPIGAHESGKIGEDPTGIPTNLMPFITQVAIGKLPELSVFGSDYQTIDGTGVRDYIHVVDLANGHVKALEQILQSTGVNTYNLGTGKGYSVLELVASFSEVSGQVIPYRLADRRVGDIDICYADPTKAKIELGWETEKGIEDMCLDSWQWQKQNPNGYEE